MDLLNLINLAGAHKWTALAAIAILYLTRIAKDDSKFPVMIPGRWLPLVNLGLGQTYAVLQMEIGGTPWKTAIVSGLLTSFVTMGLFDVMKKAVWNGNEPTWAKMLAFVIDDLTLGGGDGGAGGSGGASSRDLKTVPPPPRAPSAMRRSLRLPSFGLFALCGVVAVASCGDLGCAQLGAVVNNDVPADVKDLEARVLADVVSGMSLPDILKDMAGRATGDVLAMVDHFVMSLLESKQVAPEVHAKLQAVHEEAHAKLSARGVAP